LQNGSAFDTDIRKTYSQLEFKSVYLH
jgi:hypothetical protein